MVWQFYCGIHLHSDPKCPEKLVDHLSFIFAQVRRFFPSTLTNQTKDADRWIGCTRQMHSVFSIAKQIETYEGQLSKKDLTLNHAKLEMESIKTDPVCKCTLLSANA